tara:strand:+ start:273 stop:2327 length:2055 start_codon:yes stop_codon:yes gene_type:complete
MNKRWINTKVEFIWDGSQYVEQSSNGYWYDGDMALCTDWADMSGTKLGYSTIIKTASGGHGGFHFQTQESVTAGFLLVKSAGDSLPTYTSNGLTLVADAGHLNLSNRSHSHSIRFSTDDGNASTSEGDERMRITSAGNVGIGTEAPSAPLHVVKDSNVENASTGSIKAGNATDVSGYVTIGYDDSADVGFIQSIDEGVAYKPLILNKLGGNVGIGTSAPAASSSESTSRTLQLGNNLVIQNVVAGQGMIANNAHYDGTWKQVAADPAPSAIRFYSGNIGFHCGADVNAGGTLSTWDNTDIKMYIVGSTGKVGITTTAPNSNLHIGSAAAVGSEANPAFQIGGGTNYRFGVYTTGEGTIVENKNGDDGIAFTVKTAGEAMRVTGGTGNVGIGTTSPNTPLHTKFTFNTTYPTALDAWNGAVIENASTTTDTVANLHLRANGADAHIVGIYKGTNTADLAFVLDNAGTKQTHMYIKSSGNVGIGTSSPTEKLHINGGGIKMLGSSHSTSISMAGSDGTVDGFLYSVTDSIGFLDSGGDWGIEYDNDTAIKFSLSGGSEKMTILANGSVGIGDTSPSYKLEVAGTFYASGSSANFKKNVTDLAVDSSAIYNLNPVSYNYKKDYENFGYDLAEGKQFGLISEQVAEAVPELAIMKDGEPKNVDYQKLSVLLLAEMQKMNKRIKELENA